MATVRELDQDQVTDLHHLIDSRSARDALVGYYTFEHPKERRSVFAYHPAGERPTGFLTSARTGLDLFRPLVLPFVQHKRALRALIDRAIGAGQGFILHLPAEQLHWLEEGVELENLRKHELLRLDSAAYEPILTVLVVESSSSGQLPRYEIRTANGIRAAAGVSWKGKRFTEIYLEADVGARERKIVRSVLSAAAGRVLGEGRIPLFRVDQNELALRTEAFHVGFRPTGATTATAEAVLQPVAGLSEGAGRD